MADAADPFAYADRTSIVRTHRLPVPGALLKRVGWQPGQKLAGHFTPDALELKAAPDGNLKLSKNGVILRANGRFKLVPGDVAAFELIDGTVRVTGVDGRQHESYRQPMADSDGVPVPPSFLSQAFTMTPSALNYLNGGAQAAQMILDLVNAAGNRLTSASRILDFGCGAGRVSRALRKTTGADVVGYDLYAPAIDWCRDHMPYGRWEHGVEEPPLGEPDASFDLIFAISVLTHLNEHYQDLWLAEWRRLTKPGGLVVATFKSEHFLDNVIRPRSAEYADNVARQLAATGFAYIVDEGWAGVFPEYYRDSFHTIDYVKSRWGREFEVVAIHPSCTLAGTRQDTAVLRKSR
jgi:SAM-dependent methyltransferase